MKYHLVLGSLALMLMDRILLPVRFSSPLIFYLLESVLFISITSGPSDSGSSTTSTGEEGGGGDEPPGWLSKLETGKPKEWAADVKSIKAIYPNGFHPVMQSYFPALTHGYAVYYKELGETAKEAAYDEWMYEGQNSKQTALTNLAKNTKLFLNDIFVTGTVTPYDQTKPYT
jgi:hypothetical protein